jgi:putative competence protein F
MVLSQDCLLCTTSSRDLLCSACAGDLPRLPAQRCPVCALPTPRGEICGRCLTHTPHFDATYAVFRYGFPLDKLIQAFKYGHQLALGNYFGRQLAAFASVEGQTNIAGIFSADLIAPLPLHPARLRERGFNQSLELARPLAARLRRPLLPTLCRRVRNTPAQAELPWRERKNNIRGAFRCETPLANKTILLVDDVMTTGASLNECARTLKRCGAAAVILLVLARALPE